MVSDPSLTLPLRRQTVTRSRRLRVPQMMLMKPHLTILVTSVNSRLATARSLLPVVAGHLRVTRASALAQTTWR